MANGRLTLSRRLEESIVLTTQFGEQITVKVSEVLGGQVKLTIEADKGVSIVRKELLEANV